MDREQEHGVDSRLVGLVRAILGSGASLPEPFPLERRLSDLGVSSLKMVDLMLAIEVEFDIEIPQEDITPESFYCLASIRELVERTLSLRIAS
jgi:acyl carrier protein